MGSSLHKEYRELVENLAKNKIDARISNGQAEHAAILIENLFCNAESDVRIYSGELNHDVYTGTEVIDSVINFLQKPGTSLKILLQKSFDESWLNSHPLLDSLKKNKDEFRGEFQLKFAEGSYAEEDSNHFAVMDEHAFRYETNHEECKAIANFNDTELSEKMITVFDFVFENQSHTPKLN